MVGGHDEVDPRIEVVREVGVDDVDLVADEQSHHELHPETIADTPFVIASPTSERIADTLAGCPSEGDSGAFAVVCSGPSGSSRRIRSRSSFARACSADVLVSGL